jgi:hypothetical protein
MCVVKFTQPFWNNPFDHAMPARGACRRSSNPRAMALDNAQMDGEHALDVVTSDAAADCDTEAASSVTPQTTPTSNDMSACADDLAPLAEDSTSRAAVATAQGPALNPAPAPAFIRWPHPSGSYKDHNGNPILAKAPPLIALPRLTHPRAKAPPLPIPGETAEGPDCDAQPIAPEPRLTHPPAIGVSLVYSQQSDIPRATPSTPSDDVVCRDWTSHIPQYRVEAWLANRREARAYARNEALDEAAPPGTPLPIPGGRQAQHAESLPCSSYSTARVRASLCGSSSAAGSGTSWHWRTRRRPQASVITVNKASQWHQRLPQILECSAGVLGSGLRLRRANSYDDEMIPWETPLEPPLERDLSKSSSDGILITMRRHDAWVQEWASALTRKTSTATDDAPPIELTAEGPDRDAQPHDIVVVAPPCCTWSRARFSDKPGPKTASGTLAVESDTDLQPESTATDDAPPIEL